MFHFVSNAEAEMWVFLFVFFSLKSVFLRSFLLLFRREDLSVYFAMIPAIHFFTHLFFFLLCYERLNPTEYLQKRVKGINWTGRNCQFVISLRKKVWTDKDYTHYYTALFSHKGIRKGIYSWPLKIYNSFCWRSIEFYTKCFIISV